MKGRLRKAKKAYKLCRANYQANRYANYLDAIRIARLNAIRVALAGSAASFGASRVAVINASFGISEIQKRMSIMLEAVNRVERIKAERVAGKVVKKPPIKPRTAKRAAQEAKYLKLNREFLAEHDKCEVAFCMNKSTEVHHMYHRRGEMLLNQDYWLAVCGLHHKKITEDSKWAIENGYSISRNQTTEI